MIIQKLNRIFRYIIIIGLIVLAILAFTMKYSHCDKCSFSLADKKINSEEFMTLYYGDCINPRPVVNMPYFPVPTK